MNNEQLQKLILLTAAIGLIPIALSYGFMPEKTLSLLYGIEIEDINLKHIMRAIMGLYLGQSVIWILGFSNPGLRRPALTCMVVFMLGLAAGRMLSQIVDGIPHWLMIVYLALELVLGFLGLKLLVDESKR